LVAAGGETIKNVLRKPFIILLLAIFTTGCAQQAAFVSTPPGAQVFVDGQEIGVTPCAYNYKLSKNGSHEITITKNGYEPVDFTVVTDEVDTRARSRWLLAGAVWSPLWIGTMFTKKLKDIYDFALRVKPQRMTASADQIKTDEEM
jgi:hypothetical protein